MFHHAIRLSLTLSTTLAVILVMALGLLAGPVHARETTSISQNDGTVDQDGMKVGDGEVSIGDSVYAGHGCVRVGALSVGDCGKDKGTSNDSVGGQTTPQEETTSFGESTSPESTAPESDASNCPASPSKDAPSATVERAIDGRTIKLTEKVQGMDTVRLIGVDTPELDGKNGRPEPYAKEAAAFTAKELEDKNVSLQIGEDPEDPHHHLLAYVWTEDASEMYNLTLLEEGYARVLTIEPNDKYQDCLKSAEADARERGRGLWAADAGQRETTDAGTARDTPHESTNFSAETTASPEEAAPETTTSLEETIPESTAPENTASEDSALSEADLLKPAPEACPGAAPVLDRFAGVADARSPGFEVSGGSFVVRTNLRRAEAGSAMLAVNVVDGETDQQVDGYEQKSLGTYDTRIPHGPGSFFVNVTSANAAYEVAVFDCAKDAPSESDRTTNGQENTTGGGVGEETTTVNRSATLPAGIRAALPAQQTSEGSVPMLPDTGGSRLWAAVPAVAGLALLGVAATTIAHRRRLQAPRRS